MKSISVTVICNGCGNVIDDAKPAEVHVALGDLGGDLDLCPGCLEAWRAAVADLLGLKPFVCSCGFACSTQRGLSRHQTSKGHPRE